MPEQQIQRSLLRDVAYMKIREAIVDGVLEPGERLKDDELAEWLGMSRAPIRDALARLTDSLLVEMVPNRYTRVAPIDPVQISEAFVTQMEFFKIAVEDGVPKLTSKSRAELAAIDEKVVAAIDSGNTFTYIIETGEYFRVLIRCTGNEVLLECSKQCSSLVSRLMDLPQDIVGVMALSIHWNAIHAAVMEGDTELASRELLHFAEPARHFLTTAK